MEADKFTIILNKKDSQKNTLFSCCDTLTLGTWQIIDNNLLALTSNKCLNDIIERNVIERNVKNDSLVFLINNPIEKYFKENNIYQIDQRDIQYQLEVVEESSDNLIFIPYFETPIIKIPNPKLIKISAFSI